MSGAYSTSSRLLPPVLPVDSGKPIPQAISSFGLFLAALLAGIAIESVGPAWLRSIFQTKNADLWQTALTLLCALAVSVVVHEIGHLIPSLCFGFHVSRIAFGPLAAVHVHGRWKLQYSRAWFAASVSGIPSDERGWRARMLIAVAGGPIATLYTLLFAACLLANPGWMPGNYFLSALAQINLFLFILGLVPNSPNAPIRNDARLFFTLLQNGSEAEQIKLYHFATRLQVAGARPSVYPKELIARMAIAEGNHDLMLFNALAIFLWALDSGEYGTADEWDRYANALVEQHTLRLSDTVRCESACFDLLHRNHPASAIEKLRTIKLETLSPWLKSRAKVALQIAEGAYTDAQLTLQNARVSIETAVPYHQFELTILNQLERHARIPDSKTLSVSAAA